jgi:Fur family ferric uptake transcriptional regulator
MNNKSIIKRCEIQGLRMTDQRRTIATLLDSITDHPDVEELHRYRTVKLFEESGILEKLEFGDGRARYEDADREHHDHLINIQNGEVIEFVNSDIEKLQEKIARDLGFKLLGHKLELYGVPIDKKTSI